MPRNSKARDIIPFDDTKDRKLWAHHDDPWDKYLPKSKGFVTDFVYFFRGTAVPTSFAIWGALFAISSVIKREAWLDWPPFRLYPNLYVLFVAPPAVCKKGWAIRSVTNMLFGLPQYLTNDNTRIVKKLRVIKNRATKEFMMEEMMPKMGRGARQLFKLDKQGKSTGEPLIRDGERVMYPKSSATVFIAPELGSMFGRESYNEGIVTFLTDIYDTDDTWTGGTAGKGERKLYNLFTTFIGGTQPESFVEAMPRVAQSGGFLSRTVVVYHDRPVRRQYRPVTIPGAPTIEEMTRRLAWIAENTQGEHKATPDADKWYHSWYDEWMDDLDRYPEQIPVRGREDITMEKLAMLMKAQRYDKSSLIEKQDYMDAARLLGAATKKIPDMMGAIGGGHNYRKYATIARYLAHHGTCSRKQLMKSTSKNITAKDISIIVEELSQRDLVDIRLNGRRIEYSSNRTAEEYLWKGAKEDIP